MFIQVPHQIVTKPLLFPFIIIEAFLPSVMVEQREGELKRSEIGNERREDV